MYAMCIRDSEGSFQQRRLRLHTAISKALLVTKSQLIERNILQGVNVVRRGIHALRNHVQQRPQLSELMVAKRLPLDYIDKLFPTDLAGSVAPLAARKERVCLNRLLDFPSKSFSSLPSVMSAPMNNIAAMAMQAATSGSTQVGAQRMPANVAAHQKSFFDRQQYPLIAAHAGAVGPFMPPRWQELMPIDMPGAALSQMWPGFSNTGCVSNAAASQRLSQACANSLSAPLSQAAPARNERGTATPSAQQRTEQQLAQPHVMQHVSKGTLNSHSSLAEHMEVKCPPPPLEKPPFTILIEDFCDSMLGPHKEGIDSCSRLRVVVLQDRHNTIIQSCVF